LLAFIKGEIMEIEILKLKSRWLRWLGQKTRIDKPYWVTLLESNWMGWALSVLSKHTESHWWYPPEKNRVAVKDFFHLAILYSDHRDLLRLDNLYATEKIKGL